MLGKLIKHEWKSVSKVGCIILVAALVVSIMGSFFLSTDAVVRLFSENSSNASMEVFGAVIMLIISFGAYLLLLVGGMYGIMIYLGVHFYRSMYTDKGYLVHTLPVTPHQILLSKVIVSGLWMLLINVALILGMILMFMALIWSIARGAEPGITFAGFWDGFSRGYSEMIAAVPEMKSFITVYIVMMVGSMIITPFTNVIMMFGGLTLGQLSKKYKVLMSILAYIGILIVNYIISFVTSIASAMMTTTGNSLSTEMPTASYGATFGFTVVIMVLLSVILYFVSHFIISRKLNMD